MKRNCGWIMALTLMCVLVAGGVRGEGSSTKGKELAVDSPNSVTPSSTKGPLYGLSESELRARKFVRGFANVTLCVAEVPNQMFQEAYKTSPVTGSVVGFGKGLWKGTQRLLIGTWEMATFYHPGSNYYQPYVKPEVVFQEYLH